MRHGIGRAGRAAAAALFLLSSVPLHAEGNGARSFPGTAPRSTAKPGEIIVDSLGRRVEVPPAVDRIISLEPEITRIIVALGEGRRLVAIDFFLRHHDILFPLVYPEGKTLPVVSNQGQDLNYELALALEPDIVFSSPSESGMTESIERKLRSPVAALASMGSLAGLAGEIELVGRILGRSERARQLASYLRTTIAGVGRVDGAPRTARNPRVYLAFWGSLLRTPVSYEPVDAAGGTNCAAGLLPGSRGSAQTTVSLEQIIRWDPDIILVQGNYPPADRAVTVEGVLSDKRLASVGAVRSKRVFYTFGFWYWWDPALVAVETRYLARLFHPEAFPAFDLVKEGNAVFKEFYGADGAFGALADVLGCREWLHD